MTPEEFEIAFRGQRGSYGPHTLDSPIRYEVWRQYALSDAGFVDLLVEPIEAGRNVLEALAGLLDSLGKDAASSRPAMTGEVIAVDMPLDTLIEVLIPLTAWRDLIRFGRALTPAQIAEHLRVALAAEQSGSGVEAGANEAVVGVDVRYAGPEQTRDLVARFRWFILLASRLGYLGPRHHRLDEFLTTARSGSVRWLHARFQRAVDPATTAPLILSVSFNRPAVVAVNSSRATIKADAAHRLFNLDCSRIGWAVIDSGIDARHPAFRQLQGDGRPYPTPIEEKATRIQNRTRIEETYDLSRARQHFAGKSLGEVLQLRVRERLESTKVSLYPLSAYRAPRNDHGTHVAGILGANWLEPVSNEPKMLGICPDIRLWDLRVLDDSGLGDEFNVIAGLNLVKAINDDAGRLVIHGVNISLSIAHHVANYACGWTPVCRASEALVDSGVVVVAAAGNAGFVDPLGIGLSRGDAYHTVSITDPGNASKVITVGATHSTQPYRYGTSYFSSRGPTADGRPKPDLLAPGEGIAGPVPPDDLRTYDGTSQAAPHVSGAAALLLARYREIWGQPMEVKRILMDTANDLGRDRYFQGHGLLDVLRALQSV